MLPVDFLLTGTQQQNELDEGNQEVDASPAKQDVHHAREWASKVEAVDAHESEEEAKQHGCNFALGVNVLLRAA